MACDINLGRKEPCKDVVGGITAVYFANFGEYGTATVDGTTDEVDDFSDTAFSIYKYEVKGNSNLTQNITSSRENGTTFFEQVLSLTLHKLSKEDNKEIKLMDYGRPHVFVEDYNGNIFLVGREFGADVTGGTIVTGSAMGDMSGYTLTLTAMEKMPANFLAYTDNGGSPQTWTIGTATATIVEGTNS